MVLGLLRVSIWIVCFVYIFFVSLLYRYYSLAIYSITRKTLPIAIVLSGKNENKITRINIPLK